MKIVIAGSFAEADNILALRRKLIDEGHKVYPDEQHIEDSKKCIDAHHKGKGETSETLRLRAQLMKRYFGKINDCDILYVLNMKDATEHIGIGATLEIGYAYALGKRVEFSMTPTDANIISLQIIMNEDIRNNE